MLEKITLALVSAYKKDHPEAGDNVFVSGEDAYPLLPAFHGPVEFYLHLLPHAGGKVFGLFQGTVGPGGGDFKSVASLNGVGLIQQVGHGTGDRLAVIDGDVTFEKKDVAQVRLYVRI